MTISGYLNLFDLIWKTIGALALMIAIIWALHKFYLINTFKTLQIRLNGNSYKILLYQ
jgi:flagellar biogenesis protein FliO